MKKAVNKVAQVLMVIGALNWGLMAIGDKYELVQYLSVGWLITTVYALVGIAGIVGLVNLFKK
ncbi:MAG: DUF378 domain-containing protein [Nanoarchaeota archaeon]